VHPRRPKGPPARFDPAVVTVKEGDRVKLIITAADHDHGFKLAAYEINQKLPKGCRYLGGIHRRQGRHVPVRVF
jgi:plastocyanin